MARMENESASRHGDLFLRFVNTRSIVRSPEELLDAERTRDWFVAAGLIGLDAFVSEADAASARELREALVTVLKSHVGLAEPDETHFAACALARAADAHPLSVQIDSGGAHLVTGRSGFPAAIGAILSDVTAIALNEPTWQRFKACKNPFCYLGFRDNSRNCSALYCSHGCSSQVSMRAYRQRQAIAS